MSKSYGRKQFCSVRASQNILLNTTYYESYEKVKKLELFVYLSIFINIHTPKKKKKKIQAINLE